MDFSRISNKYHALQDELPHSPLLYGTPHDFLVQAKQHGIRNDLIHATFSHHHPASSGLREEVADDDEEEEEGFENYEDDGEEQEGEGEGEEDDGVEREGWQGEEDGDDDRDKEEEEEEEDKAETEGMKTMLGDKMFLESLSDRECMELLDLPTTNPTDLELETSIFLRMQRYANHPEIAHFFSRMHDRFFDHGSNKDSSPEYPVQELEEHAVAAGQEGFVQLMRTPKVGETIQTNVRNPSWESAVVTQTFPATNTYNLQFLTEPITTATQVPGNQIRVVGYSGQEGEVDPGRGLSGNQVGITDGRRYTGTREDAKVSGTGATVELMQQLLQQMTQVINQSVSKAVTEKLQSTTLNTQQVDFKTGKLNPVQRSTYTRMIAIDSQYRENQNSETTDFTFALSDPIRDVVSLKLYSIIIPYTWYIINNGFGTNVMYIKGMSPGIDNGLHDLQIQIGPGNYTAQQLVQAINTGYGLAIAAKQAQTGSDSQTNRGTVYGYAVAANKTQVMTYDSTSGTVTTTLDLAEFYDESDYQLYFPTTSWQSTYDDSKTKTTIPSFLGCAHPVTYLDTIYSSRTRFLETDILPTANVTTFTLNTENSYFTVYMYQSDAAGTRFDVSKKEDSSYVIAKATVQLSLTLDQAYSRTTIFNNLKQELESHAEFLHSEPASMAPGHGTTIRKVINTDPYLPVANRAWFEMTIKWKRAKNLAKAYVKTVVEFPDERSKGVLPIWTGTVSCFGFEDPSVLAGSDESRYFELSEFISENFATISNYTVGNDVWFEVRPNDDTGFNVLENTFRSTVTPSPASGYLMAQYIEAVNMAVKATNDAYLAEVNSHLVFVDNVTNTTYQVTNRFPQGLFNVSNANATTKAEILLSKFRFQFDITRVFTEYMYVLDLTESILSDAFGFPLVLNMSDATHVLLNKTNVPFANNSYREYRLSVTAQSSYSVYDGSTETQMRTNRIRIYPVGHEDLQGVYQRALARQQQLNDGFTYVYNPNPQFYGNQSHGVITVDIAAGTNLSVATIAQRINEAFGAAVDAAGTKIAEGSQVAFQVQGGFIQTTLSMVINKTLTESDFTVTFNDMSWRDNFKMDMTGSLPTFSRVLKDFQQVTDTQPWITLYGDNTVADTTISLNESNNQLVLRAWNEGVYDGSGRGANDVVITVPTGLYTKDQLVTTLNQLFQAHPMMVGSLITKAPNATNSNHEYTRFRFQVTKKYTTMDYNLVLYDNISFTYCSKDGQIRTVNWASTLGYLLGYAFPSFDTLLISESPGDNVYETVTVVSGVVPRTTYNATTQVVTVAGQRTLNTNKFNSFYVVLDDFIQNHVNDGLVSITSNENDIGLPSYSNQVEYYCDPITKLKVARPAAGARLTQNQLTALNRILYEKQVKQTDYTPGPPLKDVFVVFPLKRPATIGDNIVEFGGTMQNQDRKYFGPVRLQKFAVKLMNDKGELVDLNGSNWSFCMIAEIMEQPADNQKK